MDVEYRTMTEDKPKWFDLFAGDDQGASTAEEPLTSDRAMTKSAKRSKAPAQPSGKRARYEEPVKRTLVQKVSHWRHTRPVLGAVLLALGGYLIISPVVTTMTMIVALGVRGITVWMLGGGMIVVALVSLILPDQRHFPAIMGVFFSVASLPLANLGGWIIGMTLGIVGSGLIFAWTPYTADELLEIEYREKRRKDKRDAKKAQRQAKRVSV
jgi:hypothetical protein